MKNKIIESHTDELMGYSYVKVQNKYGYFEGSATCSDEDMENLSHYAGQRYAETRAAAQFAKFRMRQEKNKLKAMRDLKSSINYSSKCQEELDDIEQATGKPSALLRQINLKIRDYAQAVDDWKNLYEYLKTSVKKQDEERQKILLRSRKDK